MHAKRVDGKMQQGVAHIKVNEANKARGIYPEWLGPGKLTDQILVYILSAILYVFYINIVFNNLVNNSVTPV